MTRKRFRTPPTLPEETQCRGTVVPASREWLGLYSDALLDLTHAYNYEQVEATDLTPEETAQAAYLQYLAWLDSTCDETPCPPPTLPDGKRIYRKNPTTGNWEYLSDDGETWVEPTGDDALTPPEPREELTDDEKICAAAHNAVQVYYHLWLTLLDEWNNNVEPDVAYAALAVETGLTLGGVYYPPLAAAGGLIGSAFGIFFFLFDQITSQTWDDQFLDSLTCIFLDNATLNPDDTVTFAHDAIIWAINGTFWEGTQSALQVTQFTYLMSTLGPQATNRAGGVTAYGEGDCAACATWCRTFDFTTSPHDWTSFILGTFVTTAGTWIPGVGWQGTIAVDNVNARGINVTIKIEGAGSINRIDVTYNRTNGQYAATIPASQLALDYNGSTWTLLQQVNSPGAQGTAITQSWTGSDTSFNTNVVVRFSASYRSGANPSPLGSLVISSIRLSGNGENPFGVNNCE